MSVTAIVCQMMHQGIYQVVCCEGIKWYQNESGCVKWHTEGDQVASDRVKWCHKKHTPHCIPTDRVEMEDG